MSTPGSTAPGEAPKYDVSSMTAPTPPAPDPEASKPTEITLVSRSMLFYWWPVWAFAFFFAAWTAIENNHLAILPADTVMRPVTQAAPGGESKYELSFKTPKNWGADPEHKTGEPILEAATMNQNYEPGKADQKTNESWPMHVSKQPWLGVVFVFVLMLTMVITMVPLRGLWSFIMILAVVVLVLIISLIPYAWEKIFSWLSSLKIHINLAGYIIIGLAVFALWALTTFLFDRKSYVTFTPGQVKICEYVGSAVDVYPTLGMTLTKQRDDLFRHIFFGLGSGDLILKFSSGDRREVRIPNILGIGFQLENIESMIGTISSKK